MEFGADINLVHGNVRAGGEPGDDAAINVNGVVGDDARDLVRGEVILHRETDLNGMDHDLPQARVGDPHGRMKGRSQVAVVDQIADLDTVERKIYHIPFVPQIPEP